MNILQPRGCRNCMNRTIFNSGLVCTLNPPTAIGLAMQGPDGRMQIQWVSGYPPISDELPPCSHWTRRVEMHVNDEDIRVEHGSL